MNKKPSQVVTAETFSLMEAARLVGMNKDRASRWARRGWIRAEKLPTGQYLVTQHEVERLRDLLSGRNNSQP